MEGYSHLESLWGVRGDFENSKHTMGNFQELRLGLRRPQMSRMQESRSFYRPQLFQSCPCYYPLFPLSLLVHYTSRVAVCNTCHPLYRLNLTRICRWRWAGRHDTRRWGAGLPDYVGWERFCVFVKCSDWKSVHGGLSSHGDTMQIRQAGDGINLADYQPISISNWMK